MCPTYSPWQPKLGTPAPFSSQKLVQIGKALQGKHFQPLNNCVGYGNVSAKTRRKQAKVVWKFSWKDRWSYKPFDRNPTPPPHSPHPHFPRSPEPLQGSVQDGHSSPAWFDTDPPFFFCSCLIASPTAFFVPLPLKTPFASLEGKKRKTGNYSLFLPCVF